MSDFGNCQVMAENLSYYMHKNNISRYELAEIAGASYSSVTDWIKARKYPRIDKIERMANYFGVSKSALVEPRSADKGDARANELLEKVQQVAADPDPFRRELLLSILSLSEEQQQVIYSVSQTIKIGSSSK
jgi:transcriptional regulator with XRE-family HTH domain